LKEFVIDAEVLRSPGRISAEDKATDKAAARPKTRVLREGGGWNPENFAREQIRGLVRQVFFLNSGDPVRQVVLSATEGRTEIGSICRRVGEALATETSASVAVVGGDPHAFLASGIWDDAADPDDGRRDAPFRRDAVKIGNNLWLVPGTRITDGGRDPSSRLAELRREFDYSVVQGPPAGESSEAATLGKVADGIILVLAADGTRRATARKVKETLDAVHARLLGTILSNREFPIPEGIYRRL
jgi:hypothetical protein